MWVELKGDAYQGLLARTPTPRWAAWCGFFFAPTLFS